MLGNSRCRCACSCTGKPSGGSGSPGPKALCGLAVLKCLIHSARIRLAKHKNHDEWLVVTNGFYGLSRNTRIMMKRMSMVSNCQILISPSTICFSTTGTNDLYDGLPEFRSTKDTTSDFESHPLVPLCRRRFHCPSSCGPSPIYIPRSWLGVSIKSMNMSSRSLPDSLRYPSTYLRSKTVSMRPSISTATLVQIFSTVSIAWEARSTAVSLSLVR